MPGLAGQSPFIGGTLVAHVYVRMSVEDLSHQLFAMPFAVREGSIDEVQAHRNSAIHRLPETLNVRRADPLFLTDSPSSVTDFTYLKIRSS